MIVLTYRVDLCTNGRRTHGNRGFMGPKPCKEGRNGDGVGFFTSQASGIGVVPIIVIVAFVGLFLLTSIVKILKEDERGAVFRLGRVYSGGAKGPGLFYLVPLVNRMVKVDLRTVTMDVPPQDVITRDNVPTIVLPVPLDLFETFLGKSTAKSDRHTSAAG